MATATEDEAVTGFLISLTKEQRHAVASVSRSELLKTVCELSACQRCGFVEQVLAALSPEFTATGAATPGPSPEASGRLPAAAPEGAGTAAAGLVGLRNGYDREQAVTAGTLALGHGPGQDLSPASTRTRTQMSSIAAEMPPAATLTTTPHLPHPGPASASVMAQAQVLALLSARGGSSDLVGLLQFDWRGAGDGDRAGGGSDRLALSDSLLGRPRLLRRFLVESVAVMQALADDVGDCRRHSGYPGPAELASTLSRLHAQRCHTLQRLAAWGVLRAAPAASAAVSVGTDARRPAALDPRHAEAAPAGAAADSADANARRATETEEEADVDADSQLAMAIQMSLRDSVGGMLTATSSPRGPTRGQPPQTPHDQQLLQLAADRCSPGNSGRDPSKQQQQHDPPRRPQRTQPRPTGGALTAGSAAAAALNGWGSPSGRGGGSWSGPGPGRSSPVAALPAPSPLLSPLQHQPDAGDQCPTAAEVAPPPLPVSEAVAAAEGLPDVTVLVDGAAVAALSEGLRERVQHLVAQLVQVQQRRSRLEHACQHGILAAGRKLLLILLQMLWAQLRRAATAAAAAEAAATEAAEARAHTATPDAAAAQRSAALSQPPSLPPDLRLQSPLAFQGPSATSQPPQQRRRPRYEGFLADLAAGLCEDDTHLDLDVDSHFNLDSDLGSGPSLTEEVDLTRRFGRGALEGIGSGSSLSWRPAGLCDQVARGLGYAAVGGDEGHGGGSGNAADAGGGGESSGGGWDAALVAAAGEGSSATYGRQSLAPGAAAVTMAATSLGRSFTPLLSVPPSSTAARRCAAALRGTSVGRAPRDDLEVGRPGGSGSCNAGRLLDGAASGECGCACKRECAAEREQQADQLRTLQAQLGRCQASQSELQGEVGRLLDMLSEQRRVQEQATVALRRDLAQWQAEPAVLEGLAADELAELAGRLEAALSRVRTAQLQAAAERDLLCPVCWERRKGLVFGCGHQTCCACGERLSACPICREPVSLRIRVYS